MTHQWREVFLEEVADEVTVGFVGTMTNEYVATGIPFLRSKNVDSFRIDVTDLKYINSDFHSRIRKSNLSPGDVVIVRTGKPGTAALIPEWLKEANCSDLVIVRCGPDLNNRFLVYYLNSAAKQHIDAHLVGAVQQHFNVGSAKKLKLRLPPLQQQERIASVLGSLDDKIELNRRMNATLESMAQAIFKSWFIDFDPVHRNAAERSGESSRTTSKTSSFNLAPDVDSLFPDSFEESDIGPIPKNWTVELLGNHATVTRGLSYKGSGLADTGKPMFNLNSVLEGGGYKKAGLKYYTGDYFDKHEVLSGDLIVANTEQGFERLLIGYAAVVPEYFAEGGIYSHHVYRVRPTSSSSFTARYLERWINSPLPHDWITGYSNGTTVNMLPVDGLTNAQVLRPPSQIILTFTNLANAIALQQQANDQASMHYSQTRELLLPQLMSGSLASDSFGEE